VVAAGTGVRSAAAGRIARRVRLVADGLVVSSPVRQAVTVDLFTLRGDRVMQLRGMTNTLLATAGHRVPGACLAQATLSDGTRVIGGLLTGK
jgi:hypothetical protein